MRKRHTASYMVGTLAQDALARLHTTSGHSDTWIGKVVASTTGHRLYNICVKRAHELLGEC